MRVRVECHAGYKADERPLCFYLRDRRYQVKDVLDQWYGPEDVYFRVRADDENLYILRHQQHSPEPADDVWTLESFRRAPEPGR